MVMAKSKQEFDLVPLITKVKEHPILYDTSYEDYGDTLKSNRAWNGIARELLLPNGEVVRSKWKSTCDIYLKSLKGSKNAAAISQWAEHMKYFEPYLTNGKKSDEQSDNTATSTPKKSVPSKRQRSPVEVATGRRFSRSVTSMEEELGEINSPVKKSRISVLEETVESKVTSNKGTPKKSGTLNTSSQRQSRSAFRAQESQVSIDEEVMESSTSPQKVGTMFSNITSNTSPSKTIIITPDMKKGPRRLPRSVLRALEAETSNTGQCQQGPSSPSASRTHSTKADTSLLNQTYEASPSISVSSRSTKQSQRLSLGPNLTSSVHSSSRSARYSAIPEKLSSREDLLQNPISSARFSTNQTIITGANPGSFRDSVDYFESTSREPRGNDVEMISETRSIYSPPVRHSVSSLTSSASRLPRSSALEEEFAMHDAIMDTSHDNSKVTLTAPATKDNMDATDLLFLSHALTVKSFSERKQLEVKRRIAQIIAQAEIDEIA